MELQSTSNFCMLTEHLHILFKRYIINGRLRAPPEFELRDMIPTFQQGAKTNRRALQSKFKSWAKRMTLLNGNLVLSSSGKIIIPLERCEEKIMELHHENHMGIEEVITKLQKKYTWTKKNFGMDIEVVMNAISNNCKSTACKKELGRVIKIYFKKLFQGFPVSTVPQQYCQNSDMEHAEFYDYSMQIPLYGGISREEYPILQSYLSNRNNTFEVSPECLKTQIRFLTRFDNNSNHENNEHFADPKKWNILQSASLTENQRNKVRTKCSILNSNKSQCLSKSSKIKVENRSETVNSSNPSTISSTALLEHNKSFSIRSDDSSRNSLSLTRSCKKPRNSDQYKRQLIDAQLHPEIYPAVFTDPKSQFLSTFGLVPKRICSKRTLVKFTREQRKKRLIEKRRSWFVGERKGLRDRNKLNKKSSRYLRTRSETYGRVSKNLSSPFYCSPLQNSQKMKNNFEKLNNITKRPLRGQAELPRMIEPRLTFANEVSEKIKICPEIIDISSSDDESQTFKNVKTELPDCDTQHTSQQNGSFQYVEPRLFGCSTENAEATTNQMFYGQNFGYNGIFGAPNVFLSQNNVINFPATSTNPSYQPNNSFYITPQTQFPLLRPIFIPALPNNDIAVLPAGNFPIIRPLGPITNPNVSSSIETTQTLPRNTYSFGNQSSNSTVEESLFATNGNVVPEIKESFNNIKPEQPHQASQPTPTFKVFIVNKTPQKTYLLVPPNCKEYLNTAKKIIPKLDKKQPIAPRINNPGNIPLNYKNTVAQELKRRRLNNIWPGCANYSNKQKETRKDIQREMTRLSNWISKLKTSITPTSFNKGVEKFSNRLTNGLDVGITLVKDVRNALIEIEKNEDISENASSFRFESTVK